MDPAVAQMLAARTKHAAAEAATTGLPADEASSVAVAYCEVVLTTKEYHEIGLAPGELGRGSEAVNLKADLTPLSFSDLEHAVAVAIAGHERYNPTSATLALRGDSHASESANAAELARQVRTLVAEVRQLAADISADPALDEREVIASLAPKQWSARRGRWRGSPDPAAAPPDAPRLDAAAEGVLSAREGAEVLARSAALVDATGKVLVEVDLVVQQTSAAAEGGAQVGVVLCDVPPFSRPAAYVMSPRARTNTGVRGSSPSLALRATRLAAGAARLQATLAGDSAAGHDDEDSADDVYLVADRGRGAILELPDGCSVSCERVDIGAGGEVVAVAL